MSEQHQEPTRASDHGAGKHSDVGVDPKHPHPQDDGSSSRGEADDDSPVERYRDSPGAAVSTEASDVPEPNEPG